MIKYSANYIFFCLSHWSLGNNNNSNFSDNLAFIIINITAGESVKYPFIVDVLRALFSPESLDKKSPNQEWNRFIPTLKRSFWWNEEKLRRHEHNCHEHVRALPPRAARELWLNCDARAGFNADATRRPELSLSLALSRALSTTHLPAVWLACCSSSAHIYETRARADTHSSTHTRIIEPKI